MGEQISYTGEQWDPNAGFYYLRARWMEPSNGRFVSMDPYEGDPMSPVSLHRYLYANASPLSMSDPTGEFSMMEIGMTFGVSSILSGIAYVVITPPEKRSWKGQLTWMTVGGMAGAGAYGLYYAWYVYGATTTVTYTISGIPLSGKILTHAASKWTSAPNALGHWFKHGEEVANALSIRVGDYSASKYATDAIQILETYSGPVLRNKKGQECFVQALGKTQDGIQKFGYVVINEKGQIISFWVMNWNKLVKIIPELGR